MYLMPLGDGIRQDGIPACRESFDAGTQGVDEEVLIQGQNLLHLPQQHGDAGELGREAGKVGVGEVVGIIRDVDLDVVCRKQLIGPHIVSLHVYERGASVHP